MAEGHKNTAAESLMEVVKGARGGLGMLESLGNEMDEAMFVVDRDQNIVFFNDRAEELTGFEREEVLGQHCLKGIRCERCLKSCGVYERQRIKDAPLELFRKDGSMVSIHKSASVLRDESGEVIGAVEVFRPRQQLTEEKSDLSQLLSDRSLVELATLLESLGRGFFLLDEDFRITYASASISSLLGIAESELRSRSASSALGEELFAAGSAFRAALEQGQRREGWRAVVREADGGKRSVSITGAPLPSPIACDDRAIASGRYLIMIRPDPQNARTDVTSLTFEGMVARSPVMERVFSLIEQLADNDASVLISGESGTGKELVARAVHVRSARTNRPFVAVNCAALPADLLESELFGHAKGSFTGAIRDKPGRFEVAGDGTIFLDEIGDMPLALQAKLLRVLQERTFERVGETHSRPFRARVVAATNHQLGQAVQEKRFREDLYYRLNVVPITLPPLRQRREDLDILITHLLEKIGRRRSRSLRLSPPAVRALLLYDWPGNIRQLENALEYATAVCEGQTIHREDLPPEVLAPPEPPTELASPASVPAIVPGPPAEVLARDATAQAPTGVLDRYPTAEDMVAALRQSRYRKGKAAKLLGVSRTTLWRRMREEGLSRPRPID